MDFSARLLVFDTPALDEASPALSLVMAVLSTWDRALLVIGSTVGGTTSPRSYDPAHHGT